MGIILHRREIVGLMVLLVPSVYTSSGWPSSSHIQGFHTEHVNQLRGIVSFAPCFPFCSDPAENSPVISVPGDARSTRNSDAPASSTTVVSAGSSSSSSSSSSSTKTVSDTSSGKSISTVPKSDSSSSSSATESGSGGLSSLSLVSVPSSSSVVYSSTSSQGQVAVNGGTESQTPSHRISRGIIVAVIILALLLLLCSVCTSSLLLRRRAKSQRATGGGGESKFQDGDDDGVRPALEPGSVNNPPDSVDDPCGGVAPDLLPREANNDRRPPEYPDKESSSGTIPINGRASKAVLSASYTHSPLCSIDENDGYSETVSAADPPPSYHG